MKKFIALVSLLLTCCILSGCSMYRPFIFVPLKKDALPETKAKTVTVSYAESIFQERFMSIVGIVAFVMFTGPLDVVTLGLAKATESLNDAIYTPSKRTAVRHENSDYEKLLGDFDVHADFNKSLEKHVQECSHLDISIASDPLVNGTVIDTLKHPTIRDSTTNPATVNKALLDNLKITQSPRVLGIKFSYGLGARGGREQMGFAKNYRPFVKLIGILIDAKTGEILWRNFLIVFADRGYRGGHADAENLNDEELVTAFTKINEQLVCLLVESLNGKQLPPMPYLVGLSSNLDFEF